MSWRRRMCIFYILKQGTFASPHHYQISSNRLCAPASKTGLSTWQHLSQSRNYSTSVIDEHEILVIAIENAPTIPAADAATLWHNIVWYVPGGSRHHRAKAIFLSFQLPLVKSPNKAYHNIYECCALCSLRRFILVHSRKLLSSLNSSTGIW